MKNLFYNSQFLSRMNQFTINTNQAIEKITPQQHYKSNELHDVVHDGVTTR